MVNASKILTVSYGTFSCTLEGFDEPFSTMRSIAEYFRDLAADDRYFGAEPPTPDAEMLHRIAEREINRRVEAKVDKNGNGVVLRQIERGEPARTVPTNDTDTSNETEPSQTGSIGLSQMAVGHADAPGAQDVDAKAMDPNVVDSVAEKLRRIRAAVARTHIEPQFTGTFAEDEDAGALFSARTIDQAFAPNPAMPQDAAIDSVESSDVADMPVKATGAESGAAETLPDQDEGSQDQAEPREASEIDPTASDASDEDEVTFIPESSDSAFEEDDEVQAISEGVDDQPDAELPENAAVPAEALNDGGAVAKANVDDGALDTDIADLIAKNLTDADVADTGSSPATELQTADVETETAPSVPDGQETSRAEPLILGAEMKADDTDVKTDDLDEQANDDIDIDSLSARLADTQTPTTGAGEPVVEDAAVEEPITIGADKVVTPVKRARVIKMTRTEFMSRYVEATDDDVVESEGDGDAFVEAKADSATKNVDVTPESVRASLGETGLSADEEADLIAELLAAENETEGADVAGDEDLQDHAEVDENDHDPEAQSNGADELGYNLSSAEGQHDHTEAGTPAPTREEIAASLKSAVEPIAGKSGDLSVDRLLRQADSELKDNDSSRRRSAIAHLKAAVAAVRADGGRARDDAAKEDAKAMTEFRNDLARVVRPETGESPEGTAPTRRPTPVLPVVAPRSDGTATATPRPRRKMPPLMLVSEQRIDRPADPDAAPVRPRRVQSDDEIDVKSQDGAATSDGDDASNIFGVAEDFKGYVAETGAEGIQELLEASAAFGTLIEGQPFNSRPQIMQRMLRHVPEGTVTREEGLRAFGVLLREGRIIRIQRGQFSLPKNSRFKSEQKTATG